MTNLTDYILHELEHNTAPQPSAALFGDLNFDYIYISPVLESGKEVFIIDYVKTVAGAAGYVACGLAKLGAKVTLVTDLGDDEDGRLLHGEILRRGVSREGIRLIEGKKSPFTLIFSEEQERKPRAVATYLGTLATLGIDGVDYKGLVSRADLVYSCNYFLLPRLREEIKFVFRWARSERTLTAYDANAGEGWEQEERVAALKNVIYPLTDVVFLNESEARFISGMKSIGAGFDPVKSVVSISQDSTTVVIKLGARGVILRHRGRLYRVSPFPLTEKIRDTVGAGDAFQAAFLYFNARKFPVEVCAVLGSANAASTLGFRGGTEGQLDCHGLASMVRRCKVLDMGDGTISIQR